MKLLGTFEVVADGGGELNLGGSRQRAVLALLAVNANELVTIDALVDGLWGEDPPVSAVATVQAYVSNLRRELSGTPAQIESHRPGYILRVEPDWVDVQRFESLVAAGRRRREAGDLRGTGEVLRAALALWRGPLLADLGEHPFVATARVRLDELRVAALEERVEAELDLGRHREVIGDLIAAVQAHPLRESLRAQLMRALHAAGRRAEALAVYRDARELLVEELGIEPRDELRRLEQAILLEDPSIEPHRVREPSPPAGNLPARTASFVGRVDELRTLNGLLRSHRLVTLTGSGGCGKTCLALELAREVVARIPGGAWIVALADLAEPSLIWDEVATTLGVRGDPGRPSSASVVEALRGRPILLVLDNCEHLLAAAAEVVERLLRGCPELVLVATSRQALGVAGEVAWRVPNLPVPGPDDALLPEVILKYDAVQLLVERAVAADPSFAATDANAPAIAEICRRLDGIPLALELAAARFRVLSPEQVATRLDERFRLLTSGSPAAVPRHRTLRAAVEWSYDLLDECERMLFERLSVFAGSFTLELAEQVAGSDGAVDAADALDLLTALIERSLVARVGSVDGEARYRFPETLRHFGWERLAASGLGEPLRARHADVVGALVERAAEELHGPDSRRWTARLDAQQDDLRAALEWRLACADATGATQLCAAAWPFWERRWHLAEGRGWLARALELPGGEARARLAALAGDAYLALLMEDLDRVHASAREGIALSRRLGEASLEGRLLVTLAEAERYRASAARAGELCARAIELLQAAHDRWGEAHAHRVLALLAWDRGDLADAAGQASACEELMVACGDLEGSAGATALAAGLARERGDLEQAVRLYGHSLDGFRRAGEPMGSAHVTHRLGTLAAETGDHRRAFELAEESLRLHEDLGIQRGVALSLQVMAEAAAELGELERAADLCDEAVTRFRELNFAIDVATALASAARIALHRGRLERAAELCEEALGPYREEGQKRRAAPALCLLAAIRARLGDTADAATLAGESLALFREVGDESGVARSLEARAEAALAAGDPDAAALDLERAHEIWASVGPAPVGLEDLDRGRLRAAVDAALERAAVT